MKPFQFLIAVLPALIGALAGSASAAELVFGFSKGLDVDAYIRASKEKEFSHGVGCVVQASDDFVQVLYENLEPSILDKSHSDSFVPVVLARFHDGRYFILGENSMFIDTDGRIFVLEDTASRFGISFAWLVLRSDPCSQIGMQ